MKNICFTFLFVLVGVQTTHLFAQELKLKYYSDFSSGYSGVAIATYIEKSEVQEFKNKIASDPNTRSIDKLTKNNSWLAWKALGEWDYKPGETYLIMCAENQWSKNAVVLLVTISNDGKSFDYWGWVVSL